MAQTGSIHQTTDAMTPDTPTRPIQLSFPLPNALQSFVHIQFTILDTSALLFLTTSSAQPQSLDATKPNSLSALGSLVYAMPDKFNPTSTLSTPLISMTSTIETTTRIAKILTRRLHMPIYVGNSMELSGMGNGGNVEEEMAVVYSVIRHVVDTFDDRKKEGDKKL